MASAHPHPRSSDLIYDWNRSEGPERPARSSVELNDETLRDGLQSPSAKSPSIDDKLRLLHLMAELGIEGVDIGLPAAGPRMEADVARLAREISAARLPLLPSCAARTVRRDIERIAEISQRSGVAILADTFLGSSPIRQYTEDWDLDHLLRVTEDSVSYAVSLGLPVNYVTEDTTRARPEDLQRLYTTAVEAGARRVCVADTVGHATPAGARNLVRFVRRVVDSTGEEVAVDWHGHRDRGLGVANSLAAAEAGADRLHATALGIGERVGNTPMDMLLINFQLLGWIDRDLTRLPEYCQLVAEATGIPLPDNYPVVGRDAFRTGTGVHASAIVKARRKGDEWLADRVYSSVPASLVGRHQEIEVGPMSGDANIVFWLEEHGLEADEELVARIREEAKASLRVLEEDEIRALCQRWKSSSATAVG
jgi:2-isopropylmalate synthase